MIIVRGRTHRHSSQKLKDSKTKSIQELKTSWVLATIKPPFQLLRTRNIRTIEYLRNHTDLRATGPMLTLKRQEIFLDLVPIMKATL